MFLATYDPIEYWVLIPKCLEIVMFLFLAVKIRRVKDYLLNKLFFAAFLLWAVYIVINSVIYLVAANSLTAFAIATVLHRIGVSIAVIFAALIFTSALVIKEGKRALQLKEFRIAALFCGLICVLALATQQIEIVDLAGNPLLTVEEWASAPMVRVAIPITLITGIITGIPMVFFAIAIYYLLRIILREVSDASMRKQMIFLVVGIVILCVGMIYFVLILVVGLVNLATATIGHLIWTVAPIAIWKSQAKK